MKDQQSLMGENISFSSRNDCIQFCSLGSGSKGNGTLVAFDKTIILIDCGFSVKESVRRLALKGISPQQISAIMVTHEHSDHVSGVAGLANKYSIPVWLSKGTSLHKKCASIKSIQLFNSHQSFHLGGIYVTPVTVPHDAREATQFILSAANQSLGLLTDVGHITNHILDAYSACNALLLEFNYDQQMLIQGPYPHALKQRVSGGLGHLSNQQAAEMLTCMDLSNLRKLVAMHISAENNRSDLVEQKLSSIAAINSIKYCLANQAEGFDWLSLYESLSIDDNSTILSE